MRSIGTLAGEVLERIDEERQRRAVAAASAGWVDDCPEGGEQSSRPTGGEEDAGMGKVIVLEAWRHRSASLRMRAATSGYPAHSAIIAHRSRSDATICALTDGPVCARPNTKP